MKFIGNIIWLLFGGLIASVLWALSGLLLCITVLGIPFGMQCFKIVFPFGIQHFNFAQLGLIPFGARIY